MKFTTATLILITVFAIVTIATSADYYVRLDGNNNNSGTENSPDGAWKTLSYAFSNLEGGDHLYIADGLYETNELTLKNSHGTEENPTVISAINPLGAIVTLKGSPEWGNTIVAENCSYLIIDGLEVYQDEPTKGTGIQASHKSHHVTIRNCYVHDCGCNGISARGSDYVTVEKNIVNDNAKRSEWNCSGISFLLAVEEDQEPGFHHIIRQNIVFSNECRFPFMPGGFDTPTDGNGIILDLFNNKYDDNEGEPGGYTQATLIENNLSFNNGGRGIHLFQSDNVTVRNNTTWHNLHVLSEYDQWKGDIESFESQDLSIYNNITVQDPELPTQALRMYATGKTGSSVYNNIIVGIKDFWPDKPKEKDNQVKLKTNQDYPQFLNPMSDIDFESAADFKKYFGLQDTSPAIDKAFAENFANVDRDGLSRPIGNNADIGCYEIESETSVQNDRPEGVVDNYVLLSAYPNPFNPVTMIHYNVPQDDMQITLVVYNVSGQRVAELFSGIQKAGEHQITFNAVHLESGVYLLKIQTGSQSAVQKTTLVK